METIDLKGLDKAAVLAALYNAAKPQGLGFLHFDPAPMTVPEASILLADRQAKLKEFNSTGGNLDEIYFDYLKGRVMKVDLSGDELIFWLYDRDNGEGAAQRAIDGITA